MEADLVTFQPAISKQADLAVSQFDVIVSGLILLAKCGNIKLLFLFMFSPHSVSKNIHLFHMSKRLH